MKNLTFTLLLATSFTTLSFDTAAQDSSDLQASPKSAYSKDSNGTVVRSATGLCWRSGSWTPENAMPGCDGPLAPPVISRIAPDIVAPTEQAVTSKNQCEVDLTL